MKFAAFSVAVLGAAVMVTAASGPSTPPHLSQAWVAMSTGDGLSGATGQESYLYEGCEKKSDSCVNGHVFNYGANTCIKYEVDRGFDSEFSGTYYVKCDAVDCCKSGDGIPDVKKWDIGEGGKLLHDKIQYLGKQDTTGLNNEPVKDADVWFEEFNLPFAKGVKANYTYFITKNGTDVITHRIEYGVTQQTAGVILYGDFKVQHNITNFRSVFEPPAECLKPNVLTCGETETKKWDEKYFTKKPVAKQDEPACCFCSGGGDGDGSCLTVHQCDAMKQDGYKCGSGTGGCQYNPDGPFGPGCM